MEQTESDNQQRNIMAKGMVQTENGFLCDEIKAGVLAKGKRCIKLYLSNSVMKNTEGKNKNEQSGIDESPEKLESSDG